MQFQVPQFLDVEDKIVGPFTVKQVLFLAGGIGGAYVVWRIIPWGIVAILPAIAVAALGGTLAFFRYNNKPFIEIMQSAFGYIMKARLYVWRKREKPQSVEIDLSNLKGTKHAKSIPGAGGSGLKDLSWKMDAKTNTDEAGGNPDTDDQF